MSGANMIPFLEPVTANKPIRVFACNRNINSEKQYVFTEAEKNMTVVEMHAYVKKYHWTIDKIKAFRLYQRRRNNCGYSKKARLRRKMLGVKPQKVGKKVANYDTDLESLPELYDIPDLLNVVMIIKIIF
jgi:hypothetical protein